MKSTNLFPRFTHMNTGVYFFVNLSNFINWKGQEFTRFMSEKEGSGIVLLIEIIFSKRLVECSAL